MSITVAIIYGLHKGDGVIRYVGKTVSPDNRLRQHRSEAGRTSTLPVHNWMRKYGPSNIEMSVLETFTDETIDILDDREIALIAYYRTLPAELLNITDGGGGGRGVIPSDETRALMSESAKARSDADEVRRRMSENSKKNWEDPEWRAKRQKYHDDLKADPTYSKTMSDRAKIQWANPETLAKRSKMSELQMGDPEFKAKLQSAADGARHRRWHTNRNIIKDGCIHCTSAQQKVA